MPFTDSSEGRRTEAVRRDGRVATPESGSAASQHEMMWMVPKAMTATFHLDDACFPARSEEFDFHIQAADEDATICFVRVIK